MHGWKTLFVNTESLEDYSNAPAINLGLDAAPAVRQLTHQVRVLGQLNVALVKGAGNLIIPLCGFSQVGLHRCEQVSFVFQITFHLLYMSNGGKYLKNNILIDSLDTTQIIGK